MGVPLGTGSTVVGTGDGFVVVGPYDSPNRKGAPSVAEAALGIREAATAALAAAQAAGSDTAHWMRFLYVIGSPPSSNRRSAEGSGVASITLQSLKKYVLEANRRASMTSTDALVLLNLHGALKNELGAGGLTRTTDKLTKGKQVPILLPPNHPNRAEWEARPDAKLDASKDKMVRVLYRNLSCLQTELASAKQVPITSGAIVSASVVESGTKMENGTDRSFKIVARYTKRENGTNTAPTVTGAHLRISVEGGNIMQTIDVVNGGTGYMEGDIITLPPRGGISTEGSPKVSGAVAATVKVDAVSVQDAGHVSFLKALGIGLASA
jgi:hypothetical protein